MCSPECELTSKQYQTNFFTNLETIAEQHLLAFTLILNFRPFTVFNDFPTFSKQSQYFLRLSISRSNITHIILVSTNEPHQPLKQISKQSPIQIWSTFESRRAIGWQSRMLTIVLERFYKKNGIAYQTGCLSNGFTTLNSLIPCSILI